jgi:hypothetical protein
MTNWMRRRIERSRARCEKTSTTYKTDKPQTQEPKPRAGDAYEEAAHHPPARAGAS